MDKQLDLRNFLLKLKDYTSESNRLRLYDLLQQHLSCDSTLGDALSVLESLLTQNKINTQEFDIFIQTFRGINCHDAVKLLEEYKQIQQANDEGKQRKTNSVQGISTDESDVNKLLMRNKFKMIDTSAQSKSLINKIRQIKLTKYDITLVILNILIIFIFLIFWMIEKRFLLNNTEAEELIVVKVGEIHGETAGGHPLSADSEEADLKFTDTITRIEARTAYDLTGSPVLGCITFVYSNGKKGKKHGCDGEIGKLDEIISLDLISNERITQLITYQADRNITNSAKKLDELTHLITGIYFITSSDRKRMFGSDNGTKKTEGFTNYTLGFVHGKSGGHIDSLRFVWYKKCSKDTEVFEKLL